MNNYYKLFTYIIILLMIVNVLYADNDIIDERNLIISSKDNLKNICVKLSEFDEKIKSLKNLNAYDRSEEKIKINKLKKKFLKGDFIIKLASKEFELGDYDFSTSSFEIKNIKLENNILINIKDSILLNVKKENAKMIAAKKELGILDLYLKVNLEKLDDLSCKDKESFDIKLNILEYFFMCAQSNNIIDYDILYSNKEEFIKDPFIGLPNSKKKRMIKRMFHKLEVKIQSCRIRFNGYGTNIYEVNINKNGEKKTINKNNSFTNKNLEECITREINKMDFPAYKKEYHIYFSVVLSNL